MDAVTLCLAKAYTDKNRVAYTEVKNTVLEDGKKATFDNLIGIKVKDHAPDRYFLTATEERPIGVDSGLLYVSSKWNLTYSTNEMLDKPVLSFKLFDNALAAYMCPPLAFSGDATAVFLVYAYEETHDIVGLGITLQKGWHTINSNTFAVEEFDINTYPVIIADTRIEEERVENPKFYDFLSGADCEFVVTDRHIFEANGATNVLIAPFENIDEVGSACYAYMCFSVGKDGVVSVYRINSDERVLTATTETIHPIDPKYLPDGVGGGMTTVTLSTKLSQTEAVELSAEDNAALTSAASKRTAIIINFVMDVGYISAMATFAGFDVDGATGSTFSVTGMIDFFSYDGETWTAEIVS